MDAHLRLGRDAGRSSAALMGGWCGSPWAGVSSIGGRRPR